LSQHEFAAHGTKGAPASPAAPQYFWKHAHVELPESNVATFGASVAPQSMPPARASLGLPLLLPLDEPLVLPLLPPLLPPLLAASVLASLPGGVAVSSPLHPVAIVPTIVASPEKPTSH